MLIPLHPSRPTRVGACSVYPGFKGFGVFPTGVRVPPGMTMSGPTGYASLANAGGMWADDGLGLDGGPMAESGGFGQDPSVGFCPCNNFLRGVRTAGQRRVGSEGNGRVGGVGCLPALMSEMDGYSTYGNLAFPYHPPTRWRLR